MNNHCELCASKAYCKALAAYNITPPEGEPCFFINTGTAIVLNREFEGLGLIEGLENKELIETLLALAKSRLVLSNSLQTKDSYMQLESALDTVFASRIELWKTMINAARADRLFIDAELNYYQYRIEKGRQDLANLIHSSNEQDVLRALSAHDRKLKQRYDLQFDAPMIGHINRLIGNVLNARPTLMVGDKGIAKTQVAKFVASLYGEEPIVISVKGDMMSDELIGKIKHDKINGTFVFQEGLLLTAMRKGLPILLDEINFGDQAIIARLQDILLRKPHETVLVQEGDALSVQIEPGFVVFATANEASQRYRHREIIDPAIRDRFDIIMCTYPDLACDPLLDTSPSLIRLALSSCVDNEGIPSRYIDLEMLESFIRLAHVTQYLYSVPAQDVVLELKAGQLTSLVLEESQPLSTDCITPRTISRVIAECAQGNLPNARFDGALINRMIDSLDQAGSRRNVQLIQQAKVLLGLKNDFDSYPSSSFYRSLDVGAVASPDASSGIRPAVSYLTNSSESIGSFERYVDSLQTDTDFLFKGLSKKTREMLISTQLLDKY